MVDAEKGKRAKVTKNKNTNLPYIDLKSLIFGAAAYAFFPLMAYQHNIDILMAFAAIGPIYIGYSAKTKVKAILLGIVGATPLLYLAFGGLLGPYGASEMGDLIITITILSLGGIMAFFGSYLYKDRAKTKEEYEEASNVKGTKNIPINKAKRKKFEDSGSVKTNIRNLFLPSRKKK
ncbi:UbiA family prenyltransferase [Methanobrevibacter olleyae]|uniref:Uncharacterized protein n=1 Tax=Methanobrevibacter olleyae TaxID=294671 RepID=A0A126QYD0_METOL|nr:UbiA family prenyltransferase [Methanobrevibacter olleyae]AMK14817.1 hypothetical protein YLM1_0257 [Methanobrevibacter olleyae]SFL35657.1 hypothetical protein SAMN02910297_00670 [Methanobrevibacter olleyae]